MLWQIVVPFLRVVTSPAPRSTFRCAEIVGCDTSKNSVKSQAQIPGSADIDYWAASYLELPGTRRTSGHLYLTAAIGGLPVAAGPPAPGLITEALKAGLAGRASESAFGAAVGALRPPGDVPADLGTLALEFSRIFLSYGRGRPIALLHAVTAPVAARSVLPLLPQAVARPTYDALWQVGAALYAVYAGGVIPEPLPVSAPPSADAVTERAVATGDEHAIKLTEVCLRMHGETPDPVFLHAAARASELLG